MTLVHDPLFKLYAVCSILLSVLLMILSGVTGSRRGKFKSPSIVDDAKVFGDGTMPERDHPEVHRAVRAHANALENIPLFYALGLVYVLAGASLTGALVCFSGFTVARIGHAFFHLKAVQPFRSISYGLGQLFLLGIIVQIGIALAAG